jgi:hypothetical protein
MINGVSVSSQNDPLCAWRYHLSILSFLIRNIDIAFSAERLKVLDR